MLEGTVSIPLAFEPLKPHESINTLLDILFILPQYFYVYLSRNDAKKLRDMFLTTEPWNMNHETGRFGVPKPLTFKTRLSEKPSCENEFHLHANEKAFSYQWRRT